jgi:DNA-binding NtrC family response regulator
VPKEKSILIVDDNRRLCDSLARNFEDVGIESMCAHDSAGALEAVGKRRISVVLLDIMVGEENGIDILVAVKKINPQCPVIMITGFATVDTAVQALKLGAADYVKKPLDFEVLLRIVEGAIRMSELSAENRMLKERLQVFSPKLTAASPVMQGLQAKVRKLAPTDLPILITGESGTGKELVADALHEGSPRRLNKFVKVNCASFPESLLDNELFGHERGSFTGAEAVYKGLFEQAGSGTLFLDEIGDMPVSIQAKILRTLQNGEIRRIGGSQTLAIDVHFIAATNHDIDELISRGRFREDLYYRLGAAVIAVPPLRERLEDIPELAQIFLEEYCAANGLSPKVVPASVMSLFLEYPWPGNVRELKNALNYACAISASREILFEDLPPVLQGAVSGAHPGRLNVREEAEKALIIKTLQLSNFNKVAAAQRLSMSRKTLYNKIARYGIVRLRDTMELQ